LIAAIGRHRLRETEKGEKGSQWRVKGSREKRGTNEGGNDCDDLRKHFKSQGRGVPTREEPTSVRGWKRDGKKGTSQ